jgi:hypothetical protein
MAFLLKALGLWSTEGLGSNSTAKEVVEACGEGEYLLGKTAIVTGGNSGIGLETCKALASAGCSVVLCSRSVEAGEQAVKTECLGMGEGGYRLTEEQAGRVQVQQVRRSSADSMVECLQIMGIFSVAPPTASYSSPSPSPPYKHTHCSWTSIASPT